MNVTAEIMMATLVDYLRQCTQKYDEAKPDDRRFLAAATLVDLTTLLRQWPALEDCSTFPVLKDLSTFLADLEQGKSHPWAAPRSFSGSAKFSLAKQELKMRCAVAAQALIESGVRAADAYREIAGILAKTRRTGRQDGPTDEKIGFPPATLKRWHYECRSQDRDRRGFEFYDTKLSAFRADPRWPPSPADALSFAKRSLTNKMMRDRFI